MHEFRRVLTALRHYGLLLQSDEHLPCVVTTIVGARVRGSWWGHPLGQTIYHVTGNLVAHHDVLATKLVSGKVTYVHRKLWPALLGTAIARERWQLQCLSRTALRLLEIVDFEGELQTDLIPWTLSAQERSPSEAARELERRLLVHAAEIHTERGAHAKRLESWENWRKRARFSTRLLKPELAKQVLQERVTELNMNFAGSGRLPWH